MARLRERRGLEASRHGFRSTQRVWLTESQKPSREVAEIIIAHKTGSLTERGKYHVYGTNIRPKPRLSETRDNR